MHFSFAGTAQASFGVITDDVGDRPANADQAFRVIEQFQITMIPGHQFQRLIDHADALGDVFNGPLQQRPVELQHLGGFVGDAHHVFELHFPAFDGGLDHCASRGRAEHTGQQALGVGYPLAVGVLVRAKALALTIGEANKTLPRALLTHEARRQAQ